MRFIATVLLFLGCGAGKSAPPQEVAEDTPAKAIASQGAPSPKGEVKIEDFESAALGVRKSYWVYLPSSYGEGDRRYPVVYMLHGLGGSENNWVKHMRLAEAADAMAMQAIIVMPDGDDSFYMNSAKPADYEACLKRPPAFNKNSRLETFCVKSAKHEDYIATDLVAHVDSRYRTIADRKARAIGGLSMGGYGALMIAMRHKDLFSSAASHSGVTTLLYAGPIPYEKGKGVLSENPAELTAKLGPIGQHLREIFSEDLATWRAHDPAVLAESLEPGELAIYIDCGTEDEFRLQHGASYLHEVLERRGIEHDFELVKGRHDARLWGERIGVSLEFHRDHFRTMGATENL